MRAPNENWHAPISNMSASGWSPKAPGRKQSPMNIKTTPAAMIQFAVFEDMNLNPSGGEENTAAAEPQVTSSGLHAEHSRLLV
jgi:hypothetical protein